MEFLVDIYLYPGDLILEFAFMLFNADPNSWEFIARRVVAVMISFIFWIKWWRFFRGVFNRIFKIGTLRKS